MGGIRFHIFYGCSLWMNLYSIDIALEAMLYIIVFMLLYWFNSIVFCYSLLLPVCCWWTSWLGLLFLRYRVELRLLLFWYAGDRSVLFTTLLWVLLGVVMPDCDCCVVHYRLLERYAILEVAVPVCVDFLELRLRCRYCCRFGIYYDLTFRRSRFFDDLLVAGDFVPPCDSRCYVGLADTLLIFWRVIRCMFVIPLHLGRSVYSAYPHHSVDAISGTVLYRCSFALLLLPLITCSVPFYLFTGLLPFWLLERYPRLLPADGDYRSTLLPVYCLPLPPLRLLRCSGWIRVTFCPLPFTCSALLDVLTVGDALPSATVPAVTTIAFVIYTADLRWFRFVFVVLFCRSRFRRSCNSLLTIPLCWLPFNVDSVHSVDLLVWCTDSAMIVGSSTVFRFVTCIYSPVRYFTGWLWWIRCATYRCCSDYWFTTLLWWPCSVPLFTIVVDILLLSHYIHIDYSGRPLSVRVYC